jgi:AcrR family transcriptional regulator
MARKKEYNAEVVVEKAMQLFWINGYKTTSMQMLAQEMGINKFSIYASFGNKQGLFIESLKCYKRGISNTLNTLINAQNGIKAIKQFFYDSVNFNSNGHNIKGCFVTNTYNEFSESEDEIIRAQMTSFMNALKLIIIEKLRTDKTKSNETVLQQANFLLLAKHGLAAAARVNSSKEIEDYIEMTFKNI